MEWKNWSSDGDKRWKNWTTTTTTTLQQSRNSQRRPSDQRGASEIDTHTHTRSSAIIRPCTDANRGTYLRTHTHIKRTAYTHKYRHQYNTTYTIPNIPMTCRANYTRVASSRHRHQSAFHLPAAVADLRIEAVIDCCARSSAPRLAAIFSLNIVRCGCGWGCWVELVCDWLLVAGGGWMYTLHNDQLHSGVSGSIM